MTGLPADLGSWPKALAKEMYDGVLRNGIPEQPGVGLWHPI